MQSALASDMYSSPLATFIIVLLVSSFLLGDRIGARLRRSSNGGAQLPFDAAVASAEVGKVARRRLGAVVILFGVLSLLGAIRYANALGVSDAADVNDAIQRAGGIREQMMLGRIPLDYSQRIGFLLIYTGTVLSLTYWYFWGLRWWLFLSPLAVFLAGAAQAGRGGSLMIIMQAGIAAALKKAFDSSYKTAMPLLITPIALIATFVGGWFLRIGQTDPDWDNVFDTLEMWRGYVVGGISAFAYYCDHFMYKSELSFGKYTFSSLFAFLGIARQEVGVYDQYVPISPMGDETNLYTGFRCLIDDFSVVGAMIAMMIAGGAIGWAYRRFAEGELGWISFLIPAFLWVTYSPLASTTYYNSFLVSLFVSPIVCWWALRGWDRPTRNT